MNIPYRTRLRLQRIGVVALFVLLMLVLAWFCWVLWLERYVIYTDDGAVIDFEISSERLSGVEAKPPVSDHTVDIYFNEGENAIETQTELTQMAGYFITIDDLVKDMSGIREKLLSLPTGTPVMMDMKNRYGYFYYPSELEGVQFPSSVSVDAVADMIKELQMRGLYLIAKVPAYRDYLFGLNNVSCGLPVKGGYLWMEPGTNCYWLNPASEGTMTYLMQQILEIKSKGFDEVILGDFRFPDTNAIVFNSSRREALQTAAAKLVETCGTDRFAISFCVSDPAVALPAGRCRMYLEGVSAADAKIMAEQTLLTDLPIRLAFITDLKDTRFDEYGVLRPLTSAELEDN